MSRQNRNVFPLAKLGNAEKRSCLRWRDSEGSPTIRLRISAGPAEGTGSPAPPLRSK